MRAAAAAAGVQRGHGAASGRVGPEQVESDADAEVLLAHLVALRLLHHRAQEVHQEVQILVVRSAIATQIREALGDRCTLRLAASAR